MRIVMLNSVNAYIEHMRDYGLPAYTYKEIEGAHAFRDAMSQAADKYIKENYDA